MGAKLQLFLLKQQLLVNQMKTNINLPRMHREISFSQSFQYHNRYEKTNYQSPAIAIQQKIPSTSRHEYHHRQLSPVSNQKCKYLRSSQIKSQFDDQQSGQTYTPQKQQKFSQINKRIKKILIEIQDQENGRTQLSEISPNKCASPSDYGKIKSIKKCFPQKTNTDKLIINHQNKQFKRDKSKQKQNDFCTLTRLIDTINQANYKNINTFQAKKSQNSPLVEKMINNNNNLASKKANQILRSSSCNLKKSVRENFTQKRYKNALDNTEVVKKGRNIEEQMHIIESKIKQLERLKKQLECELPKQKNNDEKDTIDSKLTKNSSLLTIKTKQLTIDAQNQIFQESRILQVQSKCSQKQPIPQEIIVTQITINNKETEILVQDVQVPKILKKIKDKKKGRQKETSSAGNFNALYSQSRNSQHNYDYYQDVSEKRNIVINQKNNLLNEFKYQIKLDEEFRKAKKWLQKLKVNNKWTLVMDQLQRNLYYITESQIKKVFSIHQDQENPFYYPQETDFTVEECVKMFLAADRHWNYDMVHSYSQRGLVASNFNEQNIDINGKGHINIQDLTRYINSQLDTCYRNRDIYLIYHRFKTSEKLYYSKILNCLCNE